MQRQLRGSAVFVAFSAAVPIAALQLALMGSPHAAVAAGAERLELRVRPAQSFEPALLRIQMRVEPMKDNRRLTIATESESYFRSSTIPLDGENAPRTHEMEYGGLPPGEYIVRAVLYGAAGELASVQDRIVVLPREAAPEGDSSR